jgi:hypothetical protein
MLEPESSTPTKSLFTCAHSLLHFVRWWESAHRTCQISAADLTESTPFDYGASSRVGNLRLLPPPYRPGSKSRMTFSLSAIHERPKQTRIHLAEFAPDGLNNSVSPAVLLFCLIVWLDVMCVTARLTCVAAQHPAVAPHAAPAQSIPSKGSEQGDSAANVSFVLISLLPATRNASPKNATGMSLVTNS